MEGLTGQIGFDSLGFRSDFNLDIIELKKEGLVKVGTWNRSMGANFTRNYTESYMGIVTSLKNKTLKITTIKVKIKISKLPSSKNIWILRFSFLTKNIRIFQNKYPKYWDFFTSFLKKKCDG